jgi:hypothetical protein
MGAVPHHRGAVSVAGRGFLNGNASRHECGEAKAWGIVAAELRHLGWTAAEFSRRRQGDPEKIQIA